MELFIQIRDGQAFEHPILGSNFRQVFPNVDTNNLPAEYARFIRVAAPVLGPYEKNQMVSYQLINGTYTDVFTCEQMTADEIAAKQQVVKNNWAVNGFSSWTFNEVTCAFDPPTSMPQDNKQYRWDEPTISWIEVLP